MPIKGRLFPTQTKQERVFLLIRKHWFVYMPFGLLFILMILPVVAVMVYWSFNFETITTLNGNIIIVGASAYLLSLLGVQLFGFVDYYLDVDIVTDRRLIDIDQNGLFKRKISELYLHQVQDVEAKVEGIAATLLHFGDVYIQTAGERENFIFRSIPHPYTVAKQIVNLHEQQYQHDLTARTGGASQPLGVNLSYGELESQAKKILKSQPFSKRIANPGIFPAPGATMVSDSSTDSKPSIISQDNSRPKTTKRKVVRKQTKVKEKVEKEQPSDKHLPEEGELREGREVDLRD